MIGAIALISLSFKGWNYYFTPLESRPFRADYQEMKPSGNYSHGLGIICSLMIVVGVATYMARKRVRKFWNLGKLPRWLEFHIFLCLVGPMLVIYHTTFKVGGIAAITFWTMVSVASSGIIGRFLYVQIPRNVRGNELSLEEINSELAQLASTLQAEQFGASLLQIIDRSFSGIQPPQGLTATIGTFFKIQRIKRQVKEYIKEITSKSKIPPHTVKQMSAAASARASLLQKSLVLGQVERLFFYWHAIHLPFTVIMFITLALHVTVVLLLGYAWIF